MKTADIMKKYQYDCLGGTIEAIPVDLVEDFLSRIFNSLDDIENETRTMTSFRCELEATLANLSHTL